MRRAPTVSQTRAACQVRARLHRLPPACATAPKTGAMGAMSGAAVLSVPRRCATFSLRPPRSARALAGLCCSWRVTAGVPSHGCRAAAIWLCHMTCCLLGLLEQGAPEGHDERRGGPLAGAPPSCPARRALSPCPPACAVRGVQRRACQAAGCRMCALHTLLSVCSSKPDIDILAALRHADTPRHPRLATPPLLPLASPSPTSPSSPCGSPRDHRCRMSQLPS